LTSEQLEASRSERMRLDGHGVLTLEDARTWIEETGLCLFLPKRQFSSSIAPSFVEAVIGQHNVTPHQQQNAPSEQMLVRLELDGVVVRLNLLGLPGEQPDFVVASWVLPYVYALRGDRDWRRSPQLTGSRQVSQLAIQAYKLLEAGDTTISKLTQTLGREVTEGAVLRAITELWQQLRIIPVVSAPGQPAQWQLLRVRFQKAIAEGASTSQVTAISVLASIYLQAVIAASMEDVELFLAPLTARSKIREVLRGLLATRQVHTISLGHAPLFYVAGTLPEFPDPPTIYASASVPVSAYFLHSSEIDEEFPEPATELAEASAAPAAKHKPAESHAPRPAAVRKPAASAKSAAARPHFSRAGTHSRDRKPVQSSTGNHSARRSAADSRTAGARPSNGNGRSAARTSGGASGARSSKSSATAWGKRSGHSNGAKPAGKSGVISRSGAASRSSSRPAARPVRAVSSRKPAVAAGQKAGNSKRYGFTARPKQGTKKRG
jgi:23S rRNA pseudouridine2605 synthase